MQPHNEWEILFMKNHFAENDIADLKHFNAFAFFPHK